MAQETARGLALAAMREWRRGRRFADAILQGLLLRTSLAPADRAFANELFYGVVRNLSLLDFWVSLLRSGSTDRESRDLVRLGLYQLLVLRTPAHAALFETVQLADRRSRSLINAVLRSALRRTAELEQAADAAPLATRTSHPEFLINKWTSSFGAEPTAALCAWDNQSAPVYARINTLKITTAEFLANNPDATAVSTHSEFVRLSKMPAEALERGELYIQDPSTAGAVALLDPQPGDTVLDACAAPGGKSGLIAALMQNKGELIAADRDSARVDKLAGNLARLGGTIARVMQNDWTADSAAEALPSRGFDRILLDAPCTNTGVLRRRIDARWRLTADDFKRMPDEQLTILRRLVPLLKPGGTLVYSTCSIEPEENEQVVAGALAEFPFLQQAGSVSVLPFRDGFDGAYAAKLVHVG